MTKSKRIALAGLGGVFCLATFIMLIIFGSDSCTDTYNGDTTDCSDAYLSSMFSTDISIFSADTYESSSPQVSNYYTSITCSALIIHAAGTNSQYYVAQVITCAWSTGTEILGYIGVVAAIVFLAAFAFMEAKPFFWIGGAGGAVGILVSLILMIVDLLNGQKFYKDYFGTPDVNSWLVFATNAILAFLTFVFTGISSLMAYSAAKKESPSGIGAGFRP